jgi:hypothetical protein
MKEVTMLKSLGIIVGVLAVTAGALSATSVDAAKVCKKKSGVMIIRDACKAKETAVNLADFGAVGPMGPAGADGADGAPGTPGQTGQTGSGVRAWAVVDNGGTILSQQLIASISHPQTGVYCITPDASIDASTAVTMISVEWYHSSGFDLLAQVCLPVDVCPAGTLEVKTYDTVSNASDNVAFVFAIL